jgi:TDG/mug DNA glycosylase family protein
MLLAHRVKRALIGVPPHSIGTGESLGWRLGAEHGSHVVIDHFDHRGSSVHERSIVTTVSHRTVQDRQTPWRPTKAQLAAAREKRVRDLIAPKLAVLFCGINPGLYSAAVGHHFARPGNRFWPTLLAAGFTPRVISPFEERELLQLGYGITNLVGRATAAADELRDEEFVAGKRKLVAKLKKFSPRVLAVVGVGAYRVAFDEPKARVGRQERVIGETGVWVLPNPSGLNANYQRDELARTFGELARFVNRS